MKSTLSTLNGLEASDETLETFDTEQAKLELAGVPQKNLNNNKKQVAVPFKKEYEEEHVHNAKKRKLSGISKDLYSTLYDSLIFLIQVIIN